MNGMRSSAPSTLQADGFDPQRAPAADAGEDEQDGQRPPPMREEG